MTGKRRQPTTPIRSTLHRVLATRKPGRHQERNEKRAAQKRRREMQEALRD